MRSRAETRPYQVVLVGTPLRGVRFVRTARSERSRAETRPYQVVLVERSRAETRPYQTDSMATAEHRNTRSKKILIYYCQSRGDLCYACH